MSPRLRTVLWVLLLALLACTVYGISRFIRHKEFVDYEVLSRTGSRVEKAEPLYRADDLHYQYKYLPLFGFACIPLSHVDEEFGAAAWFVMISGLLVGFIRRSARLLPGRRMSEASLCWLTALLLGRFYVKELILGQTNVVFVMLPIIALASVQAKNWTRAGALFALATFTKPYAIIFFPWLAAIGGMAALVSMSVGLVAGLLLPATVYGWSGNLSLLAGWYQTVTSTTPENLMFGENVSFATMWAKWLGPGPLATVLALVTGLVMIAIVIWVWSRRSRVAEPSYLEFSMLLVLVPLLSPQGWDYVLLVGTPAVMILVDRLRDMSRPWQVATVASLGIIGFTIFDLLRRTIYNHILWWALVSVAAIVLLCCLANLRARSLA